MTIVLRSSQNDRSCLRPGQHAADGGERPHDERLLAARRARHLRRPHPPHGDHRHRQPPRHHRRLQVSKVHLASFQFSRYDRNYLLLSPSTLSEYLVFQRVLPQLRAELVRRLARRRRPHARTPRHALQPRAGPSASDLI